MLCALQVQRLAGLGLIAKLSAFADNGCCFSNLGSFVMGLDDRKGEAKRDFASAKKEWLTKDEKRAAFERARKTFAEERQKRTNPHQRHEPKGGHAVRQDLDRRRLSELSDKELAKSKTQIEAKLRGKRSNELDKNRDRE